MKKFIKFALASVVVVIAGFGIYQNMPQENTLSDFALENIEALSDTGEGDLQTKKVKNIITVELSSEDICINGIVHKITRFQKTCLYDGNLLCTSGVFEQDENLGRYCI